MTIDAIERPPSQKLYKMSLLADQFLEEHGGRLPAGAVVPVDEATAIRWLDRGIAAQAPRDAVTAREQKRAALLAQLEAMEDEEPRGVYDARLSRHEPEHDPNPRRMPRRPASSGRPSPRKGRSPHLDERLGLEGAGLINDLAATPDDPDESIPGDDE